MSYTPSTEYPNVIRVADPLLIRVDPLSLLVDNTSFWAKIKYGIQCKGFFIYVSGISMPIHEETFSDEKSNSSGSSAGGVKIITTERVGSKIDVEKKAKEWMDDLEEKIATSKNDNEIKRALDRMCWQMHYDITQSDTDFVEVFADQGFSDTIGIDYKQIGTTVPTNCYPATYLYPVRETAMDSAHEITGQSSGGSVYGSLYDISEKISTLDSNMNIGNGTLVTLNTNMVTLNGNIKGSGDTYTVCGAMTKIATNLRETNNEYTISKALRDKDDDSDVKCVAWSVKQQTDLEAAEFNEISVNQLGAFGSSYETSGHPNRTLFATLGDYGEGGSSDTVSAKLNTIDANIGTSNDSSSANTLFGKAADAIGRIGASSDASGTVTVFARLKEISDTKIGTSSDTGHNSTTLFGRIGTNDDSNPETLWYDVLHRAGTRDMPSGAQYQLNSPIGKLFGLTMNTQTPTPSLKAISDSIPSSSTVNTINTNVNTLITRIGSPYSPIPGVKTQTIFEVLGTPNESGTIWYDLLNNVCNYHPS